MESPETILEQRETSIVSPKGRNPVKKTSHFIKPILGLTDKTPDKPLIFIPFRPVVPKVSFNGWRNPNQQWISWVDRLQSSYNLIWKKAGIYESILSSRYQITRNDDLFFSLVERWCSETNTFVFSWGEATITLEDVNVLGGYSVLGDSVCGSKGDGEFCDIKKKMMDVYENICRGNPKRANQFSWMKYFMNGDNMIEHEGFLTLWLSRFVLPAYPFDVIVKRFIDIAIYLSGGTKIALASVVLASIYRDLSLLKSAMTGDNNQVKGFAKNHDFDDLVMATLWAPLHLVQVWAWERFPEFRPNPRTIGCGQPRLSRWHNVNRLEIGNVRPMLQAAGDTFEWRPYCKQVDNLPLPSFYRENEERIVVSFGLDEDVLAWARFLRVCELAGVDTIEQYNPHRVAMQFGYDQDIPVNVSRWIVEPDIPKREQWPLAWLSFTKPIQDHILYVQSKDYEPQVTVRFLQWHRDGILARRATFNGVARKKRSLKKTRRIQEIKKEMVFADNEADVPPGFSPNSIICDHIDVPPGFPPEPNVEVMLNVAIEDESNPFTMLKPTSKIKEELVEPLLMNSGQKPYTFPASIDPNGETHCGIRERGTSVKSEPIISGIEGRIENENEVARQAVVRGTEGGSKNRYSNGGVTLSIADRINRIGSIFKALKNANQG